MLQEAKTTREERVLCRDDRIALREGGRMALRERTEEVVQRINPKLEELAEGYVEFMDLDEGKGVLTIKLFGGRLH
jgi:hypothetical protein